LIHIAAPRRCICDAQALRVSRNCISFYLLKVVRRKKTKIFSKEKEEKPGCIEDRGFSLSMPFTWLHKLKRKQVLGLKRV